MFFLFIIVFFLFCILYQWFETNISNKQASCPQLQLRMEFLEDYNFAHSFHKLIKKKKKEIKEIPCSTREQFLIWTIALTVVNKALIKKMILLVDLN